MMNDEELDNLSRNLLNSLNSKLTHSETICLLSDMLIKSLIVTPLVHASSEKEADKAREIVQYVLNRIQETVNENMPQSMEEFNDIHKDFKVGIYLDE